MAADRQRLAQALAAEAARRRLFESIPEAAGQRLPQAPEATNYGRDLENLSIGLGRGAVNQLEGLKGLVTSPVESVKGIVSSVGEAIRNPRMIAEALQRTGERAASGPLGLGEVVGENFNMARVPSAKPVMREMEYRGQHKAPVETAASADDLTKNGIYPNDVYSRPDWYESGDGLREMWKIRAFRGNPDADVKIYRAIPKDVPSALNAGDWVTTSRKYAKQHGESNLNNEYKIISKTVKAKNIFTNGDSIFEWGYNPSGD